MYEHVYYSTILQAIRRTRPFVDNNFRSGEHTESSSLVGGTADLGNAGSD